MKCGQKMFQKITKYHARNNCQYFFIHWDSRYRPYEEDFWPIYAISEYQYFIHRFFEMVVWMYIVMVEWCLIITIV